MTKCLPSGEGAEKISMILVSMRVVRFRLSYSTTWTLSEEVMRRWSESEYQERLVVWRGSAWFLRAWTSSRGSWLRGSILVSVSVADSVAFLLLVGVIGAARRVLKVEVELMARGRW